MDFLDNVMKSSNALLKERLNNPFGKQQSKQEGDQSSSPLVSGDGSINSDAIQQPAANNGQQQPAPIPASQTTDTGSTDETPAGESSAGNNMNAQIAAIAADAEVVTQKAVKGAKNIGSFLFSMANKAGQTVSQTAKQVKQAVENTSILTDFTREQQEFIREHGGSIQAGELPWADCADEVKQADIREQILSLSQDKRNFVRNPPSDANFQFDPKQCYPVALSLLREDSNLSKMRFELVPKMVNEDTFWCNYFYRVSLLKQMSDRGEDLKRQGWASSRSSSGEGPDEFTVNDENQSSSDNKTAQQQPQAPQQSNVDNSSSQFISTQELESDESRKLVAEADDLNSKLKELDIGSFDHGSQDENDKWEEELQRDLQEFELVSGDVSALDQEALDKDIMELKKDLK